MPVLGIGGVFFRAQDPAALTAWYRDHLGIGPGCAAEGTDPADEWTWSVQGGPVVFAPFDTGTDHWPIDKQFMLNLRVRDLESLVQQLRGAGIDVTMKAEWDSPQTGRFARIVDPEGNPVELWEPPSS